MQYGIIGEGVYREIFPPTPYSVEGSATLFAQYRNDIGKNTLNSLMYTLDPTHNNNVAGDPSESRLEMWRRVSEARNRQTSLLQTAGASMMYNMTSSGNACPPQSTFDRLDTATDAKVNRQIARNLSRLINITLEEQDVWQNDDGAQDKKGPDGLRVPNRAFSSHNRL
jgi:predicted secreted protein